MEYAKHEIKLFLSEIYPEEVLKDECLDFIEKSYNALSFWGIVDKQNKNLKTIKDVVRVLNESIVRFSELQELIEDFQMDVEDDGSIEKIFQTPYHLSVYKELEKMKPIRFWKCALVFIDYMDKNYDKIIHKVSTNYDTTKIPYNRISMMRHNSYRELNEVIKRGIFSALNFKYKECSNKEVLQLLDHFKENKYVHLMLCFLASNYSKELYILGCTSAAVYESIGDDLDEEMEELVNG